MNMYISKTKTKESREGRKHFKNTRKYIESHVHLETSVVSLPLLLVLWPLLINLLKAKLLFSQWFNF